MIEAVQAKIQLYPDQIGEMYQAAAVVLTAFISYFQKSYSRKTAW